MTPRRWILGAAVAALLTAGCGRHEEEEAKATEAKSTPGQVVLSPASVQSAGIVVGVAGPAAIDVTLQ